MRIKLEDFLQEINEKTTENNQYPVLTSSKSGIFMQGDYFNKQVANKDNTGYKIIRRGQFTYRAMSDTGEFFPNMLDCTDIGIVSPAYPVFEIARPDIVVPKFLQYYFKSEGFQYSISSFAQGSTRTSIKYGKLKTIIVDVPSIDKQNEIVTVLEKVKKCIADREVQLKRLDDLIKARFVEMFGTPLFNQKGWDVITAEECCNVITDGSHFSPQGQVEGYPMLSVKDMRNDGFHYETCKRVSEDDFQILKKQGCIPQVNDVLISKDGSYFYYGFVLSEYKDQAILSSIAMLRPDIQVVNPYYLCNYMLSERIVELVSENYVTGAALKRVILKGIKHIPVMVPPIESQNEFASFVKQVDKSKVVD